MLAKRWYGRTFFLLMVAFLFWPGLLYRWMIWANLAIMVVIIIVKGYQYLYALRLNYYIKEEQHMTLNQKEEKFNEIEKGLSKGHRRLHQLSIIALTLFTIFFFLNWKYMFHL